MHTMKRFLFAVLTIALIIGSASPAPAAQTQTVVFAGGCFWGVQAVFEALRGVDRAVAGYAGGMAVTAHYEIVSTGATGHAESVQVTYDPSKISFHQLLDVYFLVAHDPTELNRQGPDEGTQYRSEIYYTTAAQRTEALAYIAHLDASHAYPSPVVTKLEAFKGFYPAESYHQDFAKNNPDNPYIAANDLPKLHALEQKYPQLVKPGAFLGN